METIKLNSGGQVSFSTTIPGITRGNHYHTRKAERFAVIKGNALIQLRKIGTDEVLNFGFFSDLVDPFRQKITGNRYYFFKKVIGDSLEFQLIDTRV